MREPGLLILGQIWGGGGLQTIHQRKRGLLFWLIQCEIGSKNKKQKPSVQHDPYARLVERKRCCVWKGLLSRKQVYRITAFRQSYPPAVFLHRMVYISIHKWAKWSTCHNSLKLTRDPHFEKLGARGKLIRLYIHRSGFWTQQSALHKDLAGGHAYNVAIVWKVAESRLIIQVFCLVCLINFTQSLKQWLLRLPPTPTPTLTTLQK